jgi:SAM-dependent MidA family methyltransferase
VAPPGVERFDAYVERCLYDPDRGFYASGAGSAGRSGGDFITSPEVGPLFAEVLVRALDAWWRDLGRPDPFVVLDAGTGPGTLARALSDAGGASAPARRVDGFDRVAGSASGLPASLGGRVAGSASGLPAGLGGRVEGAVVIANELLDNLPFRVVERDRDGRWHEVHVRSDAAGRLSEELRPVDDAELGPAFGPAVPPGCRAPLLSNADRWLRQLLAAGPALLLVLDYGMATTAELAARGGWLRTYRHHQRGTDPLIEPGRWDITTDIAVDQLPPPDAVVDQATFLRHWGIEELVAEGRAYWAAHAAAPDLAALKMRSRQSEAAALLDPDGLGSWLACLWTPGQRLDALPVPTIDTPDEP